MQNLALGVDHDYRHHAGDGAGILPQPVRSDLEVRQSAEAPSPHGPNQKNRGQLAIQRHRNQHGLTGFEREQLRPVRAQRGLAPRQQSVAIDDHDRFECAGVGDFLLQGRTIVAHVSMGQRLDDRFGSANAVPDHVGVTRAAALQTHGLHLIGGGAPIPRSQPGKQRHRQEAGNGNGERDSLDHTALGVRPGHSHASLRGSFLIGTALECIGS